MNIYALKSNKYTHLYWYRSKKIYSLQKN